MFLLLVLLVAIGAAAFYVLHRTPHSRAIPSIANVPGLSACWIETGKTFSHFSIGMTAGSILVRHPAGDLLIDTGNSSHFAQDVSIYPFWLRLKLEPLAGQLNPDVALPEMLRRGGEDPARLRWAILSLVHLGHAGGLTDLPHLTVLTTREELLFANDPAPRPKATSSPHTAKCCPSQVRPRCNSRRNPRRFFDESADLCRYGSVEVVPFGGHTP